MVLELKNIEKSFGEKKVLTGVSFKAEGGKAFGLLGRNGAGKTTSIRILMDVFPADGGEVLLDGRPIDFRKVKIGYLPEERGLYPKKIIIDQLTYFAELKGMSRRAAVKSIDYWLERLGMAEYRNKRLDTLSKGNQQKIQLITALAHDPDIVILDEPFSGLDPVNAILLKDVVKEQISKGKIVLFSSHQMSYIEEFCDSIAILADGKAALRGDLHDIKRNYIRDRLVVRSEAPEQITHDFGNSCTVTEKGDLIIRLSDPSDKKDVMKRLTENYDIDEVRVFEPSLNDIFVEYAGDAAKGGKIMKQFGKIFNFELKYYLKNKVFLGVTVFLVLLIAVVMFFPRISGVFKINGSDPSEELPVMLVKAELPEQTEAVKAAFTAAFPDYEIQATTQDLDDVKEKIISEEAECAFVLTGAASYTYYVNNLSMYDVNKNVADEVLRSVYQTEAMVKNGVTPEQAAGIMSVQIQGVTENLGVDQTQNFFYTYIMIFALYMVILLYGQMVATNVATEKSSRAMELLITSAKPASMMFGKVIASCLAGLIQLVAVFGSAFIFFNINRSYWADNMIINSIFDMPPSLLAYMLVFFVLGFLVYAFLYGAIGSTASKLEDINTSVMPITMLFIIAFFVVVFSFTSGTVDSMLMKVCSYIPFTSPMAMFTRIAMSTVPWYEIVISVAVLIGSVVGVGFVSAKIYRVGVLLYGTTPKIGSVLKSVWKA